MDRTAIQLNQFVKSGNREKIAVKDAVTGLAEGLAEGMAVTDHLDDMGANILGIAPSPGGSSRKAILKGKVQGDTEDLGKISNDSPNATKHMTVNKLGL